MSKPFKLPVELTIYSATETRDAMLAWVTEQAAKPSGSLEVSAAEVREIDGAGLQLLASLSNMDQSWQLVDASETFSNACRALGLGHLLGGRCISK